MKNDGYMDLFYEVLGEKYHPGYPFSCFMYYGQYDVPVKGTDKEWMEGSEEVYTYLLCVISPLTGEYEPVGYRSLDFCIRLLRTGVQAGVCKCV